MNEKEYLREGEESYTRYLNGEILTDINTQKCMHEAFMKNNPHHNGALLLACACPKCSPRC